MKAGRAIVASIAALLACACAGAHAQQLPVPVLGDAQLSALLEGNATLETRLDTDLDGDGEIDTVFVAQDSRSRFAIAMLAYRDGDGSGHRRIGRLRLDTPPQARARLAREDGLLLIDDFTGSGDTVTQAAYRFRFDRKARGLRLAGLGAARYSRRRMHDAVRLNWDPASGREVLAYGKAAAGAGSDAGYRYGEPRITRRKAGAVAMDATPTADQALWRAGVRFGEGPAPD